jgi:hypothetical protein
MRCVRLFLNRLLVFLGGRGGFVFARSCAPNNRSAMHFWRRSNLWGGSLATALFCTRFGSATGLLPSVPFWVEILTFFTNPFDLIGAHVRGRESAKQQHDHNANMAVARRCLQAHSTNRFFRVLLRNRWPVYGYFPSGIYCGTPLAALAAYATSWRMQAYIALDAVSAIRWSLNVCKVQRDPAPQCACRVLSND